MLLGAIGLIAVLGSWQICVSTGLVDERFTSSPFGAVHSLAQSVADGTVWEPVRVTLTTIAIGLSIALVIGIPAGLLIGRNRVLYGLTEPLISIMYSVPYVVFLPIIILWFGISTEARVVIVLWGAVFPLMINVIIGARNLDRDFLNVAKVSCASRFRTFAAVTFPASLPHILGGIRQAVGRGLVAAIVGELFMGSAGLGYEVVLTTSQFDMNGAMSNIIIIGIIAIALTKFVGALEGRFTSWSTSV